MPLFELMVTVMSVNGDWGSYAWREVVVVMVVVVVVNVILTWCWGTALLINKLVTGVADRVP